MVTMHGSGGPYVRVDRLRRGLPMALQFHGNLGTNLSMQRRDGIPNLVIAHCRESTSITRKSMFDTKVLATSAFDKKVLRDPAITYSQSITEGSLMKSKAMHPHEQGDML